MRVHLIKDNMVINTIEIESVELTNSIYPDHTVIEATCGGNGWRYENGELIEPPTPMIDPADEIKKQITALEATVTPRRRDEAILGIDNGWLANVRDQIAALRSQLGVTHRN